MSDLNLVVDCPECGTPVSVWCDCPECGWYDPDAWEAALVDDLPPDMRALVEDFAAEAPDRQAATDGGRVWPDAGQGGDE